MPSERQLDFVIPKRKSSESIEPLEPPKKIIITEKDVMQMRLKTVAYKNLSSNKGVLEMAPLEANHSIPIKLWDIENGNIYDEDCMLEYLEWIKNARRSQSEYVRAFGTLLYLEESAQSKALQVLNKKDIKLTYLSRSKMLAIENNVS